MKKYDNLIIIFIILLITTGIALCVHIDASDELWLFQHIYKMCNGYTIYQDANVICTPLFFYLGEIIFKILGANFLIFRIYHIIIITLLFFFTYKILKKLGFSKKIATIILLIIIMSQRYGLISLQANYNLLALTFIIIGIYFLLNKNNSIIQAIFCFLIFITKQNIGIFYALGFMGYIIAKEEEKNIKIKQCLTFIISIIFLIGCGLLFLWHKNLLNGFINYAILGIKEFSSKNIKINIQIIIMVLFFIIINPIISNILIKYNKINKKEKENLILLNSFSLPLNLYIYPLINIAHFMMGCYLSFILFVYLCKFLIMEIKINYKIINYIFYFIIIVSIIYPVINLGIWIKTICNKNYTYEYNQPYYGGIISEDLKSNIDKVIEYIKIKKEKVIILSDKAGLYMIPLKQSNGDFDLPFRGNLGKEGEDGLIKKLQQLKETLIMIEKDENNIHWQESRKVRNYIENNFEPIEEIENFIVYKSII